MLDAQDIQEWRQVAKESAEIAKALGSSGATSQPITPASLAPQLGLEGLKSSAAEECSARYVSQLQDVASKLQRHFREAFDLLQGEEDSSMHKMGLQALRRIYADSFDALARNLTGDIVGVVRRRRAVFMAEASGENDGKAWDPQAKALLEKAWERNQKLNAAEKRKLAEGCGLTTRQVSIWFANQRQRRKPYSTTKGHRARITAPRKSSSSSIISSSSASVPSLSSSPSSRASSGSWDRSPVLTLDDPFEPKPKLEQKPNLDRLLSSLAQPSEGFMSDDDMKAIAPELSLTQPTPSNASFPFETFKLPSVDSFTAPSFALDIDAGVGDDFWQSIMQATGLDMHDDAQQDDFMANIAIAPAATDWSAAFETLDFTAFQ
ncbi:MAG: hypothetical protein CYPHOPRED_001328 [Cyphobasidiales sp. Tagirdzhanova-0007]|nr:MAG: hypothetical protein CYPHOPRED_001328 [Cyphobasidiales sp. Tagirdzhanova-0007]